MALRDLVVRESEVDTGRTRVVGWSEAVGREGGGIVVLVVLFGALALAVVWRGFTMEPAHRSHRVDYVGAALLTAGVSAGLLATVWGGSEYPWGSPEIVGLFLACAVLLGALYRYFFATTQTKNRKLARETAASIR